MSHKEEQEVVHNGKVLELDAGNTRLKWRLLAGGEIVDAGYLANTDCWKEALPALLDGFGEIGAARISLVSGEQRKALLTSVIHDQFGIEVHFACVRRLWKGLMVSYKESDKLGVDRWLAMLAAEDKYPNQMKLVVDCGTALTLDIVDANGIQLGGYIVPGLGLMAKALHINTAGLISVEQRTDNDSPGNTTGECISRGNLAMTAAFVSMQAQKYGNVLVCLTGGDGHQIASLINSPVYYQPDLVMDGLGLASF